MLQPFILNSSKSVLCLGPSRGHWTQQLPATEEVRCYPRFPLQPPPQFSELPSQLGLLCVSQFGTVTLFSRDPSPKSHGLSLSGCLLNPHPPNFNVGARDPPKILQVQLSGLSCEVQLLHVNRWQLVGFSPCVCRNEVPCCSLAVNRGTYSLRLDKVLFYLCHESMRPLHSQFSGCSVRHFSDNCSIFFFFFFGHNTIQTRPELASWPDTQLSYFMGD